MNDIQKTIIAARMAWVGESEPVLLEIESVLEQAYKNISKLIRRKSANDKLSRARLRSLQRQIRMELVAIRPKITGKINKLKRASVKAGVRTMDEISVSVGAGRGVALSTIAWNTLNTNAMTSLAKYSVGGFPLSKRVWDITWSAEKSILNTLEVAVLLGKSVDSTVTNLKKYLIHPKVTTKRKIQDYNPGSGTYKSANKNARRLARTEMNRAFVEGVYEYGKYKSWILGYKWRTASGDPCPVCNDKEGDYYPKESPPPIPAHPQCMCYPEPVYEE